jgi:hypothetical protein
MHHMKRLILPVFAGLLSLSANSQKTTKTVQDEGIQRPKLVVGIVIDQMRWDYLYVSTRFLKPMADLKDDG